MSEARGVRHVMVGMVAVRVGPDNKRCAVITYTYNLISPPDSGVGVAPLLPCAVRVVVAEAVIALLILGVILRCGHMGDSLMMECVSYR